MPRSRLPASPIVAGRIWKWAAAVWPGELIAAIGPHRLANSENRANHDDLCVWRVLLAAPTNWAGQHCLIRIVSFQTKYGIILCLREIVSRVLSVT